VAIGAEHDVVGGKRVGGDEEAEVALDDQALVVGEAVGVLPGLDVALHVYFLRHPVVGTAGEVLVPSPLVLEWNQLVDVGFAVDHALVLDAHAAKAVLQRLPVGVEVVHRLAREDAAGSLCAQRFRRRRHQARLRSGSDVVVEIQHFSSLSCRAVFLGGDVSGARTARARCARGPAEVVGGFAAARG
jgi:hypothetical protein